MKRLAGLLGLLAVTGLAVPPTLAFLEKTRRDRDGVLPFDEDANELDYAVIFGEIEARSHARAFRGGKLLVWYGGGMLDLRGATLDPAGATLSVRAIFGGLEILVPESWPVVVHASSTLGATDDATDPSTADPSAPTLVLETRSIFGGITVDSRPDEPESILVGASPG